MPEFHHNPVEEVFSGLAEYDPVQTLLHDVDTGVVPTNDQKTQAANYLLGEVDDGEATPDAWLLEPHAIPPTYEHEKDPTSDAACRTLLPGIVSAVLSRVYPEGNTVKVRFGITDGDRQKTIAETSTILGSSNYQVERQLRAGIQKLRHPSATDQLRDFL